MRGGHLLREWRALVVGDELELDLFAELALELLHTLVLVEDVAELSAAGEHCHTKLLLKRTVLLNLEPMQDVLRERPESSETNR